MLRPFNSTCRLNDSHRALWKISSQAARSLPPYLFLFVTFQADTKPRESFRTKHSRIDEGLRYHPLFELAWRLRYHGKLTSHRLGTGYKAPISNPASTACRIGRSDPSHTGPTETTRRPISLVSPQTEESADPKGFPIQRNSNTKRGVGLLILADPAS